MNHDLSTISGADLGRLYARGEITPVDATEFFLDRIVRTNDPAIFIATTFERAHAEAKASADRYERGVARGPLDGVPVAWKDLFDLAGTPTTAGSDIYRHAPPAKEDAVSLRHATEAGLVAVGKVNLSEFAYSGLGLNPHYGTPLNPHSKGEARVPGGSSSGSAVAIAAGLVPCAIGTDTGGSVRIPAAFTGIVGLKTGEGRIDRTGVFPLSHTLDTIGPLARSVEDCVMLEAAMRGEAAVMPESASLSGLRFVVARNIVCEDVEEAVIANFERTVAALARAGAIIEETRLSEFDEFFAAVGAHGALSAAEGYRFHEALVTSPDRARIDPRVLVRILRGGTMSAADVAALHETRLRLRSRIKSDLAGKLLLMPTVAHVAPLVEPLDRDPELFQTVNNKTLRNTTIGNFLDLPGFALPSGSDASGMPTSILVSSLGGAESLLYPAAASMEKLLRG